MVYIRLQSTPMLPDTICWVGAVVNATKRWLLSIPAKQKNKFSQAMPDGTFLSTMLLYMVLQKGMKAGNSYAFNAIAEEDAQVHPGTLKVVKEEEYIT